jgi:hypothetical protein
MTLAMESEAEIDIADESSVEVDASCLMSRTSVETPSKRSRKNTTTTELAEEDVFLVPNGMFLYVVFRVSTFPLLTCFILSYKFPK